MRGLKKSSVKGFQRKVVGPRVAPDNGEKCPDSEIFNVTLT